MCWNDRRYRRARRHGHATANLTPASEPDPDDPAAPPAPTWPHLPSTGTPPPLPPGTGTGPIARYPWDDDKDEEPE
jgi:hypothetical protein